VISASSITYYTNGYVRILNTNNWQVGEEQGLQVDQSTLASEADGVFGDDMLHINGQKAALELGGTGNQYWYQLNGLLPSWVLIKDPNFGNQNLQLIPHYNGAAIIPWAVDFESNGNFNVSGTISASNGVTLLGGPFSGNGGGLTNVTASSWNGLATGSGAMVQSNNPVIQNPKINGNETNNANISWNTPTNTTAVSMLGLDANNNFTTNAIPTGGSGYNTNAFSQQIVQGNGSALTNLPTGNWASLGRFSTNESGGSVNVAANIDLTNWSYAASSGSVGVYTNGGVYGWIITTNAGWYTITFNLAIAYSSGGNPMTSIQLFTNGIDTGMGCYVYFQGASTPFVSPSFCGPFDVYLSGNPSTNSIRIGTNASSMSVLFNGAFRIAQSR
jgi:hypothetical protein